MKHHYLHFFCSFRNDQCVNIYGQKCLPGQISDCPDSLFSIQCFGNITASPLANNIEIINFKRCKTVKISIWECRSFFSIFCPKKSHIQVGSVSDFTRTSSVALSYIYLFTLWLKCRFQHIHPHTYHMVLPENRFPLSKKQSWFHLGENLYIPWKNISNISPRPEKGQRKIFCATFGWSLAFQLVKYATWEARPFPPPSSLKNLFKFFKMGGGPLSTGLWEIIMGGGFLIFPPFGIVWIHERCITVQCHWFYLF